MLRVTALTAAIASVLASGAAFAENPVANKTPKGNLTNPNVSVVLDAYYQDGVRALGEHSEGFNLGHNELAISAAIDDKFYGKFTTVLETHDGSTELNIEEAFIQTLAMPAGFSIRGGRFLSDIGYLNPLHKHTDSFAERPIAYRAFLGNHYYDDGARLNWVAPTETYWVLGAEGFSGRPLTPETDHDHEHEEEHSSSKSKVPVFTAYTKIGGDIGESSSWRIGLNYLYNKNGARMLEEHHDEEMELDGEHDEHDHSHSAAYTGENMAVIDAVFKWAPGGNYKYNHLTLSGEYFQINDIVKKGHEEEHHEEEEHEEHGDEHHDEHGDNSKKNHKGWYASAVYQFTPSWSAGLRYGQVDAYEIHGDHLDKQQLKETDIALNWHPSHFSVVRFQYTHQKGTNFEGFNNDKVFTLQYVMTLGAHGAHQF
ncbi:hypothetical protein [Paraferrimonas sedimenticola]|uniref:TonB-dependent receptor n=1 Tax=Paraferrimonas sedimenticola TaxID=375674 RepID=A0AA37RY71_9GAMM|nr:hypothetical protein [Paraferrimonas sedimenticola]GLP97276.1 TonB-dependent receptor [Paraferrimonas sedimenticola]